MTTQPPEEPTFASPSPAGSLPPVDLGAVDLPPARPSVGSAGAPGPSDAFGSVGPDDGERAARARVRRRRALLLAGAAVALVVAAVGVAFGVQSARDRAWSPVEAELDGSRSVNAVQLVLGSCIESLPDDGPVGRVVAVPCDEPHEAQVVGRTDADPDAVWSGDEAAAVRAARVCGPELLGDAARGGDAPADLRFVVWAPSEDSWSAGDRSGLCLVFAPGDTSLTGSLLS